MDTHKQCFFDVIMYLITSTIGNKNYLSFYDIKNGSLGNKDNVSKQLKNNKFKPGLYSYSYGANSVHYFGAREEKNGMVTIGNGYPTSSSIDNTYSIGLNVQKDHSHGLCQVYALMYYNNKEQILQQPSKNDSDDAKNSIYFLNVITALTWLRTYTLSHGWNWEFNSQKFHDEISSLIKLFDNDDCTTYTNDMFLKTLKSQLHMEKDKVVHLAYIIDIALLHNNRKKLKIWFDLDRDFVIITPTHKLPPPTLPLPPKPSTSKKRKHTNFSFITKSKKLRSKQKNRQRISRKLSKHKSRRRKSRRKSRKVNRRKSRSRRNSRRKSRSKRNSRRRNSRKVSKRKSRSRRNSRRKSRSKRNSRRRNSRKVSKRKSRSRRNIKRNSRRRKSRRNSRSKRNSRRKSRSKRNSRKVSKRKSRRRKSK
jgi:hypothetical protein